MSLNEDNISDQKGQFGSDIGTTYFSYSGPNSFDAATTANLDDNSNDIVHQQLRQENSNNSGTMGRKDGTTRSVESLHLSQSEVGDRDVLATRGGRPYRDPQNVLFLAPPYPGYGYGYGYPGVYNPAFCPPPPPPPMMNPPVPYEPVWRSASDDGIPLKRSENPYPHLKHMRMKHFIIFIAVMFLLAFVAVVFTAVYFGHRIA